MHLMRLKVITPKKIVREEEITGVTVPTTEGEITILPNHANLFSLMNEGIVKIKYKEKEEYLAIGGGYIQTDGGDVTILVSKAYGQNEIDEKLINKAIENAKNIIKTSGSESDKAEAMATLRRAVIDSKLLKKKKPKSM